MISLQLISPDEVAGILLVVILELVGERKATLLQPVREAVSYRGLFTAGWFGVREKHCSRLKIYDRLRASEQAASCYP